MFEIKKKYFIFKLIKFQSSPILVLVAIGDTDVFETVTVVDHVHKIIYSEPLQKSRWIAIDVTPHYYDTLED